LRSGNFVLNSRVLKFRRLLFSPIFAGFRQFWRDSGGRCGAIFRRFYRTVSRR